VLVNNAATWEVSSFEDVTAEETRQVVDTTLTGTLNLMRIALADLLESQGTIVNIVTDSARVGARSMSLGTAAQAGIIAVTKSIALEVGRHGVRANVIASGMTIGADWGPTAERLGGIDKLARAHPLGRLGTPADIASAVVFLASPMASWITGQVLAVNGGYTMA
jgi:NAD(P)-dependent dehydrogenase (short-subunit alcohol dehydrogenase family)